jgi:hypothetical protein
MILFIIATFYSLFVLGIALIIESVTLAKIIPQAGVKNGLQRLRKLLMADGIFFYLLTLIAFVIIGARYVLSLEGLRVLSYTLLMIFSTIVVIKSVVKLLIYTINYSDESKKVHEEIAEREEVTAIDKTTRKRVRLQKK